MTLRDDLIAAKALIDTPEDWSYWGVWNALVRTVGEARAFVAYEAMERLIPQPDRHLRRWENQLTTTHADIMALFERAITAAESAS